MVTLATMAQDAGKATGKFDKLTEVLQIETVDITPSYVREGNRLDNYIKI